MKSGSHDPYPTLTSDSFVQLIENLQGWGYEEVVIIEARYPYEFISGHIFNAISCYTDTFRKYSKHENICFVFHCEFSQERAQMLPKSFEV
jgi:hypothetical protein